MNNVIAKREIDSTQTTVPITKVELVENVQKWVLIDKQLKIIHEKTKRLRDMKKELGKNITTFMASSTTNHTIDITNGELKLYEKNEYEPVNLTYIKRCLSELIQDNSKVEYIMKYLKDNREMTTIKDIKRIEY
jgi:hypothetical protein